MEPFAPVSSSEKERAFFALWVSQIRLYTYLPLIGNHPEVANPAGMRLK